MIFERNAADMNASCRTTYNVFLMAIMVAEMVMAVCPDATSCFDHNCFGLPSEINSLSSVTKRLQGTRRRNSTDMIRYIADFDLKTLNLFTKLYQYELKLQNKCEGRSMSSTDTQ